MPRHLRGSLSLVVTVGLLTGAWARPARASELWVTPTQQQDIGGVGIASSAVWPASPIGAARFVWGIPNNLQTFQGAKVVLIPHAPGGAATLNVIICAAQNGQPVAGACAGPFPHAFTGVVNQLVEVDISADVATRVGAAGVNYLAVLAYTAPTTTTDHIVGLRFAFDPKLGATLFTGTQTIDGGNLDLDPSTASAGNILKNGTRFLHNQGGPGNLFAGLSAGNLGASTTNSTENTGLGFMALSANLFGARNTAVGAHALRDDPGGAYNTAVGWGAMQTNAGGGQNTALGAGALEFNTLGTNNTAVGFVTMHLNTGNGNTTIGMNGLANMSGGSFNTALGFQAGYNLMTGSQNLYVGNRGAATESDTTRIGDVQTRAFIAGVRGTTPANADAVPVVIDSLGQLGTVSPSGIATLATNTFGGTQTIDAGNLDLDNSTATTGSITKNGARFLHNFGTNNLFLGINSGNLTMTGQSNMAIGLNALTSNTTGVGNVALGGAALVLNSSGNTNTSTGGNSMGDNTTGSSNTATGNSALRHNVSGNENSAFGLSALFNTTTGSDNTAAGNHALRDNITGSGNTAIGYDADVAAGNLTNATAVGFGAIVDASNKVRIGNASVTLVETAGNLRVGAGSLVGCVQDGDGTVLTGTCISDARFKTDVTPFGSMLNRLVELEPVHFKWKAQEYPELQLGTAQSFGLIAQEAEKALPELVAENAQGHKVVKYHLLPLMLVRAMKEQQAVIERQAVEHASLKAQVASLASGRAPLQAEQSGGGAAAGRESAARLQRIEDRAEIELLLLNYGRHLDARDFKAYSQLFARDGVWEGGFGTVQGQAAIQAFMEKAMPGANTARNFHLLSNFVIEVQGDTATAWSRWQFVGPGPDGRPVLAQAGRYDDALVREDGRWKFKRRVAGNDLPLPRPAAPK